MSRRPENIEKVINEADQRVMANAAMIAGTVQRLWPHEPSKYHKSPVIKNHATLGELEGMQVVKVGKRIVSGWWPNYSDFDAFERGFQLDGKRWILLTQVDLSILKAPLRRAAQANSEGFTHLIGLADVSWPWTPYYTSLVGLYVPQGEVADATKLHREMIAQDSPMVSIDTPTLANLNIPTAYIRNIHTTVTGIAGSQRESYLTIHPNLLANDRRPTELKVRHQHLESDTLATYHPLSHMRHVFIGRVNETLDKIVKGRFKYVSPWQKPGPRLYDDDYNPHGSYISDRPLSAQEIAQLLEKIGIQIRVGNAETVKEVDVTFRNLQRPEPRLRELVNIPLDSAIPSPYVVAAMRGLRKRYPQRTNPDLGSF